MKADPPALLIENQYLPPVHTFARMARHQRVVLEACEHYQKGSFRNRCYIAGANGVLRLSIPLLSGKNQQSPIREVRTDNRSGWAKQHWASLQSAYGKAPFFEHYAPDLEPLFLAPPKYLFDLNLELITRVSDLLDLGLQISLSSEYQTETGEGVLDLRDRIRPGRTTDAAFRPIPYPQVFGDKHGFLPNMSILDLLFCGGPQTPIILEASLH